MTLSLKLLFLTAMLVLSFNMASAAGFNSLDRDLKQCAFAGEETEEGEKKKKKKVEEEEEEEEEPDCE